MNVTALKAMIKHWKPMMTALLAVCAELRGRLALGDAAWTIGGLHPAVRCGAVDSSARGRRRRHRACPTERGWSGD